MCCVWCTALFYSVVCTVSVRLFFVLLVLPDERRRCSTCATIHATLWLADSYNLEACGFIRLLQPHTTVEIVAQNLRLFYITVQRSLNSFECIGGELSVS